MNKLDKLFQKRTRLLWDGGMGSCLIAAGLPSGQAPEGWNIERPEVIGQIHEAYLNAGADVIQTNTFGGNSARLKETKCPYDVEKVNGAAVKIALHCKKQGKFVAGNIGPTGYLLPPLGNVSEMDLYQIFSEQVKILADHGADLITVETMSDLREAMVALRAVRENISLPVIVCLTFRATKRGFFTIVGNPLIESLRKLLDAGADGIGANCTLSSEQMVPLAKEIRDNIQAKILIEANAGEPRIEKIEKMENGIRVIYPETLHGFAKNGMALFDMGIDFVGGCCGTAPEHIKALDEIRRKSIGKILGGQNGSI